MKAVDMGTLIITCPHTGKKFATGIQIERDSLAEIGAGTLAISFCPHCRQHHEWRYGDAEYLDVPPPRNRVGRT